MTEWVWRSWGGHKQSVEADEVRFESAYVIFFRNRQMILAVREHDCADLHPANEGDPAWW